jgi:hypothetical protein
MPCARRPCAVLGADWPVDPLTGPCAGPGPASQYARLQALALPVEHAAEGNRAEGAATMPDLIILNRQAGAV